MNEVDVLVIGAGPAGMAAAIEAARHGLKVQLLDEQPRPGGQIYRAIDNSVRETDSIFDDDYWDGLNLVTTLHNSDIKYIPQACVWTVDKDPLMVGFTVQNESFLCSPKFIVLATGAYERPVAIPGWTLPGVMTAGAAQILMKSEGATFKKSVILAGSGPLLLLVASQLLKSGTNIKAFLDTTKLIDYLSASPYLPGALLKPDMLLKGLKLQKDIRSSQVQSFSGVENLRCEGTEKFESIHFERKGKKYKLEADLLLLHQGVVPNTQISRLLNLEHDWVDSQRYWKPKLNIWAQTSDTSIYMPGDGGGINGAAIAEVSGRIAALDIAKKQNKISANDRDQLSTPLFAKYKKFSRIRPLLDNLYKPPKEIICPTDPKTIVCRCEEIDVEKIRKGIDSNYIGPNQLKANTRCGMGPCQGRMCGLTVAEIIADSQNRAVEDVGYYNIRSPIKPISLSAIANLK